jgi:ribonuclease VapC
MIAVDSSAILAMALDEDDARRFVGPLAGAPCLVGWPTLFEVHLVLRGKGKTKALAAVELWRARRNVTTVDFDQSLFEHARDAFDRYGKGLHPAKLNFGDCLSYALAKREDVPLLYKGSDFAKTDVPSALP